MENEITVHQVTAALERASLRYQVKGRYIVSQCPLHEEKNPSCQIFLDDWFCSCLAGCGRFPITRAFPELRTNNFVINQSVRRPPIELQRTYKSYDLRAFHAGLPLIPRVHQFKNLPLEVLDDLGWRWDAAKQAYLIPYYSQDRQSIPFGQWRYLSGSPRFTFLPGAKPTLYGKWNIEPGGRLFIVEGSSDGAVLQHCMVPWIAAPSAASGVLLANFARHAATLGISLVYAGDNDQAGDALRAALDETEVAYRVCQPPDGYKDWGDLFVAQGESGVTSRTWPKLFE